MFLALALTAALAAGAPTPVPAYEQRLVAFSDRRTAQAMLETIRWDLAYTAAVPASIEQMFERVDVAYRQLFPTLMAKKAKPALFATAGRSLADGFTRTVQEVPGDSYFGLLVVPTGILEGSSGEASLAGTIAHQLAHLYFNHSDMYRVLDSWHSGAFPGSLDASTHTALNAYVENARLLGQSMALFEGFPFGGGMLQKTFDMLFGDLASRPSPCSGEVARLRQEMLSNLKTRWSVYKGKYLFTPDEEREFRGRLRGFEKQILACSQDVKSGHESFSRLFEIGASVYELTKREYSSKLENVRWRSPEDEADEYAVLVMNHLALPPTDFSRQIVVEVDRQEPGLLERCDRAIRERREVPFGDLGNPQHTPCYRLQQVTRFANRMYMP